MEFTRNALLMLLVFWSLQLVGSWIQWRHYRGAMNGAIGAWSDGFLGVGQSKRRFGAGAIAMLSVTPDLQVRQLRTMKGISVFARFRADQAVEGWTLAKLAAYYAPGTRDTAEAKAVRQAITQVEEVRRRKS